MGLGAPPARLGGAIGASDYVDAQRLRVQLRARVDAVFARYDVLLGPTVLKTAPRFEDFGPHFLRSHAVRASVCSVTGHPAVSLPVALDRTGLPIGMELAAPYHAEQALLRVAQLVEEGSAWRAARYPEGAAATATP